MKQLVTLLIFAQLLGNDCIEAKGGKGKKGKAKKSKSKSSGGGGGPGYCETNDDCKFIGISGQCCASFSGYVETPTMVDKKGKTPYT